MGFNDLGIEVLTHTSLNSLKNFVFVVKSDKTPSYVLASTGFQLQGHKGINLVPVEC